MTKAQLNFDLLNQPHFQQCRQEGKNMREMILVQKHYSIWRLLTGWSLVYSFVLLFWIIFSICVTILLFPSSLVTVHAVSSLKFSTIAFRLKTFLLFEFHFTGQRKESFASGRNTNNPGCIQMALQEEKMKQPLQPATPAFDYVISPYMNIHELFWTFMNISDW